MIRLFTAIAFPEDRKEKARNFFRGRLPVAYVNTTNLHVTLNFLGEVKEDDVEAVKRVCREVASRKRGFELEFDGVVKFHQQLHMTVVPGSELEKLQRDLERELRDAGFKFQERQYYPHVTLANMHMDKVMNPLHRIESIGHSELAQLNFFVQKVTLFESKLLMHHAHHSVLEEYKFL